LLRNFEDIGTFGDIYENKNKLFRSENENRVGDQIHDLHKVNIGHLAILTLEVLELKIVLLRRYFTAILANSAISSLTC
jgi:hypothetical protein